MNERSKEAPKRNNKRLWAEGLTTLAFVTAYLLHGNVVDANAQSPLFMPAGDGRTPQSTEDYNARTREPEHHKKPEHKNTEAAATEIPPTECPATEVPATQPPPAATETPMPPPTKEPEATATAVATETLPPPPPTETPKATETPLPPTQTPWPTHPNPTETMAATNTPVFPTTTVVPTKTNPPPERPEPTNTPRIVKNTKQPTSGGDNNNPIAEVALLSGAAGSGTLFIYEFLKGRRRDEHGARK